MKLHVLVVDDDPIILEIVKGYLKQFSSLEVTAIDKPEEALEILTSKKMHVLILDVVMPELDGLALMEKAKAIDPLIHVIMMSAHSTLGRVIYALGAGAMDFVLKPFEGPKDMQDVVKLSIERWERWSKTIKTTAQRKMHDEVNDKREDSKA